MTLSRRRFGASVVACAASFSIAPVFASTRPAVVVIGGGPGGISVARSLAASGRTRVTLVEPDARYTTCFFGNLYLAGMRRFDDVTHAQPVSVGELVVARDRALAVDGAARRVRLASGATLAYDRLVMAPGIGLRLDAIEGYSGTALERMPHAWHGGTQHRLLRERLEAMPDGGLFVISAPALPFRCPPGPYERASTVAAYFARTKPRSKIVILDAKDQHSKQGLFHEAWARLYPGMIEWVPASMTDGGVRGVDAAAMTLRTADETFRAAAANVIPPQRAADVALESDLADETGWCPVDPRTLESTRVEGVHVIGDAMEPGDIPKSAYAAQSEADACAAAILAHFAGEAPPDPVYRSVCWSMLGPDTAVKVGASYDVRDGVVHQRDAFISQLGDSAEVRVRNAEEAQQWYRATVDGLFG